MIDDREIREMLERRVATIPASPTATAKAIKRARRRLAVNAVVGGLLGVAVVAGMLVGLRTVRAAPTPADSATPTPSPAGSPGSLGVLAYLIHGDVYVADWDGANPVRIANGRPRSAEDCSPPEYYAEGPIWSPDGRYLSYWRCLWGMVVISDPEGNVMASFPGEGWLIAWSPDSTRVAVWVRWGETIGVYGLDGQRQELLTLPPGLMAPGDFDPVWSSDGTSLLVPHGVEIPLDGSAPRRLPSGDPRSHDAVTSPDGSRVAYVANMSLVVAAADGSDPQEMVGHWVWHPVWSPNGNQIVFTSSKSISWPYGTELRVLDPATGKVTSLVGAGGSDHLLAIGFSPDGGRLLFSRVGDMGQGASSLWSINADGTDPRRLVTGTAEGEWQTLKPTG